MTHPGKKWNARRKISFRFSVFSFQISRVCSLAGLLLIGTAVFAQDAAPRSVDPRLKVELFAENPQIVTPTGIDVDQRGRVWAVESNTHFPPEGYKGHPSDRVLVMSDADGDGK